MSKKEPNLRERAIFLLSPKRGNDAYNRRMQKEEQREETKRKISEQPRMSYGSHGASRTLNSLVGWIIEPGDAEDNIDLYSSPSR